MDDGHKDYIDAKCVATESRVEARFAEFDARVTALEIKMENRFAAMEALVRQLVADLRAEMHRNTADIIKWMVGLFVATIAIFVTVVTFVLNNAIPKAPAPAPVPQSTPAVIIQMPPWPPMPASAPAAR